MEDTYEESRMSCFGHQLRKWQPILFMSLTTLEILICELRHEEHTAVYIICYLRLYFLHADVDSQYLTEIGF